MSKHAKGPSICELASRDKIFFIQCIGDEKNGLKDSLLRASPHKLVFS